MKDDLERETSVETSPKFQPKFQALSFSCETTLPKIAVTRISRWVFLRCTYFLGGPTQTARGSLACRRRLLEAGRRRLLQDCSRRGEHTNSPWKSLQPRASSRCSIAPRVGWEGERRPGCPGNAAIHPSSSPILSKRGPRTGTSVVRCDARSAAPVVDACTRMRTNAK